MIPRQGERVRQNLDGDLAAKVCIEGAIDFAHPTLTDLGAYFMRAEAGAGSQSQGNRLQLYGLRMRERIRNG